MTEDSGLKVFGGLVGAIVGGIAAYNLGAEAIEYAGTIVENIDTLSHMITQHPNVTKYLSTFGGMGVGALTGAIPGDLYEEFIRN